ncbi:uncharacterized protein HaLaN_27316, partial [Haematococcus lacustris]
MEAMYTTGFQATSLGQAVTEINRMIKWRLSDDPITTATKPEHKDPAFRSQCRTIIFLGFTSNLGSADSMEACVGTLGVGHAVQAMPSLAGWLLQHRMVDAVVATAGGVEEDLIKCLAHTYVGDFHLKGAELRAQGLNRIGNMLVPNSNYCAFEDWMMPILNTMLDEQEQQGTNWTPSKVPATTCKVARCRA